MILDIARDVRKALVACAVIGWLGLLIHLVMEWIAPIGGVR